MAHKACTVSLACIEGEKRVLCAKKKAFSPRKTHVNKKALRYRSARVLGLKRSGPVTAHQKLSQLTLSAPVAFSCGLFNTGDA